MSNLIEIKTVQASAIRILVESIKDILTDVNLHINEEGIKLIAMDGAKAAVVYLKLESNKFEKYLCLESFMAGINMASLFKILKCIKNSDSLTFYVTKECPTKFNVKIENSEKRSCIISSLKLLDIDEDIISIPDIEFDTILTIPSHDFQNYIRDLSQITNTLKIQSKDNNFILSGEGDFANTQIVISQSNTGLSIVKGNSASGSFNIKFLTLFIKSTHLCSNIELYLKDNFPLILVYSVANLGKLQYCLAPKLE